MATLSGNADSPGHGIEATTIEAFVEPLYAGKDVMHDLSHVRRVLQSARALMAHYAGQVDEELILCGAYFHGIVRQHEPRVVEFLTVNGLCTDRIRRIVQVARESLKDEDAESLEGKILHDAHLTEGGRTFVIVKSLMTGAARGQTLEQTIDYFERNILGRFACCLPVAQQKYEEQNDFAREVLRDLKQNACLADQSKGTTEA
jgi:uncharacterized protein